MSRETYDEHDPHWVIVGKFSHISATEDGTREFLEKIPVFAREQQTIGIDSAGFAMPKVGNITVGSITAIDFVPLKRPVCDEVVDGLIVVKRAN